MIRICVVAALILGGSSARAEEPLQLLIGKERTHPLVQAFLKQHRVVVSPDLAKKIDGGAWEGAGMNFRLQFDQRVVTEVAIGRMESAQTPLLYGLRQGQSRAAVLAVSSPSIVSREEKADRVIFHHAPELPYDTIFVFEGKEPLLRSAAVLMKLPLVMALRERGKQANRIPRIQSPALEVMYKRCDHPLVNALLGRFGVQLRPESCEIYLNVLRLDRIENISGDGVAMNLRGGVIEGLTISARSAPGQSPLPLGLEIGVTTAKQIEALSTHPAVEMFNITGSNSYTLRLRYDNPFELIAMTEGTGATRKLHAVRINYRATPDEEKARDQRNQQEKAQFAQLLARVNKELTTPSAPPPAPTPATQPRPGGSTSAANDAANAPVLRRIHELRGQLGTLQVQYRLAADDRDRYASDRSYKAFEGSYNRRDNLGNSMGPTSSYSSRQSASAGFLQGDATRRAAQLEAQIRAVLAEIEQLQRQLK